MDFASFTARLKPCPFKAPQRAYSLTLSSPFSTLASRTSALTDGSSSDSPVCRSKAYECQGQTTRFLRIVPSPRGPPSCGQTPSRTQMDPSTLATHRARPATEISRTDPAWGNSVCAQTRTNSAILYVLPDEAGIPPRLISMPIIAPAAELALHFCYRPCRVACPGRPFDET